MSVSEMLLYALIVLDSRVHTSSPEGDKQAA